MIRPLVRSFDWDDIIAILLIDVDANGNWIRIAQPPEFKPVIEGEVRNPTLNLDRQTAQALIDGLWAVGLRPREGLYTSEVLRAKQEHLEHLKTSHDKLLNKLLELK